jgi:hypothetical protein
VVRGVVAKKDVIVLLSMEAVIGIKDEDEPAV